MKQKVKSAKRMRIEGAGPKIMAPLFVTFAITAGISYAYRPTFNYPLVPASWTLALLIAGLLSLAPYNTALFLVAGFLCLLSSG